MKRKVTIGVVTLILAGAVILAASMSSLTGAATPKSCGGMQQGSIDKACPFMPATDTAKDMCCPKTEAQPTKATDPVCKMTVATKDAAGKSEYKGKTYYFCSTDCKGKFDKNPGQYVK